MGHTAGLAVLKSNAPCLLKDCSGNRIVLCIPGVLVSVSNASLNSVSRYLFIFFYFHAFARFLNFNIPRMLCCNKM